jgi:hypothetical protein
VAVIASRNGGECDRDRGLKFGAAIVTSPKVIDPAGVIEA